MPIKRMSILGTGLIGGSIGLACKQAISHVRIVGYSRNKAELVKAREQGAIDEIADDLASAVADSDLVILCTPTSVFVDILRKIGGNLKTGTIVTDVGSTKRSVVATARAILPETVIFVGSHPMAGGEKHGIENARVNLLHRATCIITPDETTDLNGVQTIESFWRQLKMETVRMTPDLHDRLVADISHLPHVIAAAMIRMQSNESLKIAARGFADSTRIAAGDSDIWRDIVIDNRDNIKAGIDRLQRELSYLKDSLDGDPAAVKQWLATAEKMRREWGGA